ncbi:MAG: hypothetical protein COT43_02620 [Candidatus Marinimicrobia bacterium CG08_land_8_20_14_0_20_45_22]|nr:MAG: hypothetical protein COT43_02620 [Candidatus Marinimicrobia bacterium CG08_land_8_20_14_0_20_45_22]
MTFLGNVLVFFLITMASDSTQMVINDLLAGSKAPFFYTGILDGGDFYLSRKVGPKASTNGKKALVISFFHD